LNKIIVFTQDGCNACNSIKKKISEQLKKGEIIEYNLSKNSKARRLAKELGIVATPTFITVKDQDVCILDNNLNPIICRKVERKLL
jgi:thioredoxin-related protein